MKEKESLKTSETSNRIRVVADVDLRVVGKTLVARGFISYASSTLMRDIFSKIYNFKVIEVNVVGEHNFHK